MKVASQTRRQFGPVICNRADRMCVCFRLGEGDVVTGGRVTWGGVVEGDCVLLPINAEDGVQMAQQCMLHSAAARPEMDAVIRSTLITPLNQFSPSSSLGCTENVACHSRQAL